MRLEVTDTPLECDEAFVIAQTRAYNATFAETDVRSLCVFARDHNAAIIGGLTGRTYWRYLDIAFLWVDEKYRGRGLATKLMNAAESEARNRGCQDFFQAEDGIRDSEVTGVQTCALPISATRRVLLSVTRTATVPAAAARTLAAA